jgi:hypothetical protein
VKLTDKDLAGVSALVGVVSRFGTVTGVDDDLAEVTIGMFGMAYHFAVHGGSTLGAERLVMLVAVEGVAPGWSTPKQVVFIESTAGSFMVPADVASWIAARFDTYGRCEHCEQGHHASCVAQVADGACRCLCAVDWAVTRARTELETDEAAAFVPQVKPAEPVLVAELAQPWPPTQPARRMVLVGDAQPLPRRRARWALPRRR